MLTGVQPDTVLVAGRRWVADDVRQVLRDLAPAAAVYVGVRVLGLVVLVLLAGARGVDGLARLDAYDAPRLLGVAAYGYDPLGPLDDIGRPINSSIAFFPLYPLTVRIVATFPGLGVTAAGFLVTALAGLAAAGGLDRLGRRLVVAPPANRPGLAAGSADLAPALGDGSGTARRARVGGLVLVALWACWPHSAVLAMPYTESLFVALAAWSMVALLDARWIAAGVLCLLAGATRPLGTALAVALVVAAAVAVGRDLRDHGRVSGPPLLAAGLAPLGFLAYWGWLWMWTGRPDAWFWVQAQEWRSTFDGGRFTLDALRSAATEPQPLVLVVCAVVVVASVVLLLALVVEGGPLPVLVYTALATYTVIGAAGYENSKPRFLLCVFPLLVPLARTLACVPVRTLVVLLGGAALVAAWYNAYVLVVWTFSP